MKSPGQRWRWLGPLLVGICGFHLYCATLTIQRSNQDSRASDQGAEMWLAATSQNDVFPQRTDGVRHPLFSWLVRHWHVEDAGEFFARGKWFNTFLCLGFLAALGTVASHRLGPLATANLLLLSSLGILLVRGTYFQPEPLYYILFFCSCVLAWDILRGASGKIYPVFGLICGFTYLAKPSLLPLLVAFAGAVGLKFFLALLQTKKLPRLTAETLAGTALAILLFGAIITPLGLFSAHHFGKPFFNYPKYWMWMDDFETQAWPWQEKFPGRAQLETLPPEEIPSFSWYFQRHSPQDALNRLTHGTREVFLRFLFPEPKKPATQMLWRSADGKKWEQPVVHRGGYLLVLGGLCAWLAWTARKNLRLTDPGLVACWAFAGVSFVGYTLLYGWYWPIGRGDRFMGSLWIPCLFLLISSSAALLPKSKSPWATKIYPAVHALIFASLLLQALALAVFLSSGEALTTKN